MLTVWARFILQSVFILPINVFVYCMEMYFEPCYINYKIIIPVEGCSGLNRHRSVIFTCQSGLPAPQIVLSAKIVETSHIFFIIIFFCWKENPRRNQICLHFSRNANKQEIIKAYRKLAQQWHPDNFQSEDEKKEAEKRFIDIAAAKEVLTDPGEKRLVIAFRASSAQLLKYWPFVTSIHSNCPCGLASIPMPSS